VAKYDPLENSYRSLKKNRGKTFNKYLAHKEFGKEVEF